MTGWVVVVPVKPAARGKSRLDVPGVVRTALVRAIALDTIAAAQACALVDQVVVVSDDGDLVLAALDIPGLRFVPESEPRGLNAAVTSGFAGFENHPRAAVLGDLPALLPEDFEAALTAAGTVERGVVADAEGTGSTMVTVAAGLEWASAFGEGSFARHVSLGCTPLAVPDASTLRRDVDTAAQLRAAAELGLGPRTRKVIGSAFDDA